MEETLILITILLKYKYILSLLLSTKVHLISPFIRTKYN